MNKNLLFFFTSFFISLPFFWGLNVLEKKLEDFFFWQEIANNPKILTAEISQKLELEKLKPIRNWQIEDLEVNASSAISVLIKSDNSEKILFEKNGDKILPIASLSKLMTAKVVLENYDLFQKIEINKEKSNKKEELPNEFKSGENFSIKQLLYPLLMESNNEAAIILANLIGENNFVELMNSEAKNLGLKDTFFINPTGLDNKETNSSTAKDLVKLTKELLRKHPLIWEILSLPEIDFYTDDGIFHHKIINTNEFLKEFPSVIVGGKTGNTPRAGECLLLVIKAPENRGYIINIILGSNDRFGEMRKLLDWINKAYRF